MNTIEQAALEIESRLLRTEKNEKIKITPRRTERIAPPEFTGKFVGTESTEIKAKNGYPFPVKIILVAQPVENRKEPKIIRIPNFLIEKIRTA